MCREFNRNSQPMRNKKQRKHKRKKKKKKTITRTRRYLCGSTICLRPRSCRDFTIIKEKYKVRLQFFSLTKHGKSPIKSHAILFGSGQVVEPDKKKLGSTKPNKSLTWRLVQSPTSTAILQTHNPLIPATHPFVLKLEGQLKLHTTSTSQQ